MKKYEISRDRFGPRILFNERPSGYRETLKTKLNTVSEKKRSVEAAQKSSETKSLKEKTKEKETKVSEKKSELDHENEIPDEQDCGQFELNGLMTRVLEDELQTIMIEVWQALPDDPTTEAERFVAETIRHEASDELKNVLGLNVTKRLLNVYNPLFVKINFSCRPESGCLTKFLDLYNVKEFKRIHRETNTFAARLNTITDFDNICSAKDIRCGSAKITVSSYYKFSQCPEKLNTIYSYKDEKIGKTETDINEIQDKKETDTPRKIEKPINESNTSEGKRTNVSEKEQQNKIAASETKELTKTQKQLFTEKVIQKDNIIQKKTDATKSDTSEKKPKTKELKTLKSLTTNLNTSEMKPKIEEFKSIKRPSTKTNTSEKKPKINELKTIKSSTTKPNTSEKKPKIEEPKQNNNIKKPIGKPAHKRTAKDGSRNKILSKPKKSTELKQNIIINDEITDSEINNEFDEFGEEMNDEEILALISGGVIVDECIGSDDE